MTSQCSDILPLSTRKRSKKRRWLTAEHPLRRGEHEATFRDGLHLLVMIARYLVGRYLEDFVPVGNIPQCE